MAQDLELVGRFAGRVRSSTDPDQWYACTLEDERGQPFCPCKGYAFRKDCRHLRLLREKLGTEAELPAVTPAAPSTGARRARRGVLTVATSRYQAGDKIAASGLVPVGITVGSPRFKIDYRDRLVYVREASPKGLIGMEDVDAFVKAYYLRLEEHGFDSFRERFTSLADDAEAPGVVLLCFEDVDKEFCHRQAFAVWWSMRGGKKVKEL